VKTMELGALLLCAACGAGVETPSAPVDAGRSPWPVDVRVPFEATGTGWLTLAGTSGDAGAELHAQLDYAFAPGLPTDVQLETGPGASGSLATQCLWGSPSALHGLSLDALTGSAVSVTVVEGHIGLALQATGPATAHLHGLYRVQGGEAGGCYATAPPAEIPVSLELDIRVHDVAGYTLDTADTFGAARALCLGEGRVPQGWPMTLPTPRPVDSNGAIFTALNAARPAGLEVTAPGGLVLGDDAWAELGAGEVELRAVPPIPGTVLPAGDGRIVFTVVAPEALTSFAAHFEQLGSLKDPGPGTVLTGGQQVDLTKGRIINLVFDAAAAGQHPLCVAPPASWYATSTLTPQVCGWFDATVAQTGPGTCELLASIPGTAWQTRLDADFVDPASSH
jgi:hypothetical protein